MAEIARELGVGHVVVGLPLGLDGNENEWCAEIRAVGEKLAGRLEIEVSFVDERMTSVRAERAIRALGLSKKEREQKGRIDAAAAQLILQAWLNHPEIAR
jgi:putative Holliday junction resolvase